MFSTASRGQCENDKNYQKEMVNTCKHAVLKHAQGLNFS